MGEKTDTGQSETRILLQDLAVTLNGLVVREHQILQEELKQLSSLFRDAISTLEKSFHSVNTQVLKQSDLAKSIAEALDEKKQHLSVELDNISTISEQINKNVATAVRSLQVEDIIQQLAAHSNNRAEQIEQLFVKLGDKLNVLKSIATDDTPQIEQIIHAMQVDMEDFRKAVEKDNPVKQVSMDEGKIELF